MRGLGQNCLWGPSNCDIWGFWVLFHNLLGKPTWMDEVRSGWETWFLPEPTDRFQQRKKCFGPERSGAAQRSLGFIPGGGDLDFHLSKWRCIPRHPISNVPLLNANSWKGTRTSAEPRPPRVIGKGRPEQEEEEIMIIYLLFLWTSGVHFKRKLRGELYLGGYCRAKTRLRWGERGTCLRDKNLTGHQNLSNRNKVSNIFMCYFKKSLINNAKISMMNKTSKIVIQRISNSAPPNHNGIWDKRNNWQDWFYGSNTLWAIAKAVFRECIVLQACTVN